MFGRKTKISALITAALVIALAVSAALFGPLGFMFVASLFIGIPIFYLVMSFKIIRAEEKAVGIRLGKPKGFLKSGPTFVWRFFERLKVFSAGPQQVEIGTVDAFSEKSDRHESAKISADVALRFFWPDGKQLISVVPRIRNPYDLYGEVLNLLKRNCIELVKEILSRLDWERAYANRERTIDVNIEEQLKNLDRNHILKILKLKNIEFQITNVQVPENLLRAPAEKEIREHEKAARKIAAEAKKIEIMLRGEGRAESLKRQREAMGASDETIYVKAESKDDDETISVVGLPKSLNGKNALGDIAKEIKTLFKRGK